MRVLLFKDFHKQDNSTKLPSVTPPLPDSVINVEFKLKENTSLTRPVIIITQNINTLSLYTFARISDFNRWYKITDVVSINNTMCEVYLEVDVLGSYVGAIKSETFFFERAPINDFSNGFLEDKFVSTTYDIVSRVSWSGDYIPSDVYSSNGTFILGAVSSVPSNSIAGVAYYALSAGSLKDVLDFIFDDDNFTDELSDNVNKTFFNPFQYIVSLKWLPFKLSAITGNASTTNIKLGWWNTGVNAPIISVGRTVNFTTTTSRPSYTGYGDFRDMSDTFTRIHMFIPSIGTIPISALDFNGDVNTPSLVHYVDIVTGDAIIKLQYGTEHIASYTTHFSVDIPIGQQASTGVVNGVHDAINSALQTTSKAPGVVQTIASGIKNVSNTVVDVVSASIMPQPSVNGNQGNMSTYKALNSVIISIDKMGSGDRPSATVGFPYYKYNSCANVGEGFYKATGASISIPYALASEIDQVNAYLNGGFFYES